MGRASKIEWTHHTFNPWRGCTKVSAGCAHCYADTLSKRNPGTLGVWGPNGSRVVAAESYWRLPVAWDVAAGRAGERHRVFCASLADVFEGTETMPAAALPAVRAARVRLFDLIRRTPHLDWLLLTKRPHHWRTVVEESLILAEGGDPDDRDYFADRDGSFPRNELAWWLNDWAGDRSPANVWLGTSVEDQATADARVHELLRCPAAIRFLSAEPLIGPVDLRDINGALATWHSVGGIDAVNEGGIHWVIVGGESGPDARPMHPDWPRGLRDQCVAAGVPFFFKQHGEFLPIGSAEHDGELDRVAFARVRDEQCVCVYPDGSFDADGAPDYGGYFVARVGKKAAGRMLDGREWSELPAAAGVSK